MSVTPHYIKRGGLSGGVLTAAAPMGKTVVISPGKYLNSIANWVWVLRYYLVMGLIVQHISSFYSFRCR
jgi:hypothetical protein